MHPSSFNDLIGLPYQWGAAPWTGKTDCFQLACEVRSRLGLKDYSAQFDWVYELYDDHTFPKGLLGRWVLQHGTRTMTPSTGALALLPASAGSALSTVVEDGAVFLSPAGMVVKAPLPAGVGHFFWMNE